MPKKVQKEVSPQTEKSHHHQQKRRSVRFWFWVHSKQFYWLIWICTKSGFVVSCLDGSKGVPSSSFPSSSRKSKPNQTHETGKDAIHQCCYCGELVIGGAFIFHSHIRQKHRQFVDCITCVGCNSKLSSLFALRRHQGKCELMVDILKEWGEVGG